MFKVVFVMVVSNSLFISIISTSHVQPNMKLYLGDLINLLLANRKQQGDYESLGPKETDRYTL